MLTQLFCASSALEAIVFKVIRRVKQVSILATSALVAIDVFFFLVHLLGAFCFYIVI